METITCLDKCCVFYWMHHCVLLNVVCCIQYDISIWKWTIIHFSEYCSSYFQCLKSDFENVETLLHRICIQSFCNKCWQLYLSAQFLGPILFLPIFTSMFSLLLNHVSYLLLITTVYSSSNNSNQLTYEFNLKPYHTNQFIHGVL